MLRDINVAFDGATVGINGLDTGTMSDGNWYYLHVIYNPTTDNSASLISLSATAPTLPSGYTMRCRAGAVRVQVGASAFTAQEQKGNEVTFGIGAQNVVTLVYGGTNTTATMVSTLTAAPPTANNILIVAAVSSGACSVYADFTMGMPYLSGSLNLVTSGYVPFKVANSITYRMVQPGTGYVRAYGYRDNI